MMQRYSYRTDKEFGTHSCSINSFRVFFSRVHFYPKECFTCTTKSNLFCLRLSILTFTSGIRYRQKSAQKNSSRDNFKQNKLYLAALLVGTVLRRLYSSQTHRLCQFKIASKEMEHSSRFMRVCVCECLSEHILN